MLVLISGASHGRVLNAERIALPLELRRKLAQTTPNYSFDWAGRAGVESRARSSTPNGLWYLEGDEL